MINPSPRPDPLSRAEAKAKVAETYARMARSAHEAVAARGGVPSSPLRPERSPMTTQTVQGADGGWRVELRGGGGSLVMSRPASPEEIPAGARRRAEAVEDERLLVAFGAAFRPPAPESGVWNLVPALGLGGGC
ncbi:MAG: hypothetical protein L0H84_09235 [Pseudonocardia sp.]|nr:hypothetical protein [Pseudonocardia sp.]